MTVAIDDIRNWSVLRGVGCVVTSISGGWVTTACHHWRTGGATEKRPARICRACRKALPRLTPAGEQHGGDA